MSTPTLRVLPGGRAGLQTRDSSGGRRRSDPRPSGESSATAFPPPTDERCNADWDELLMRGQEAWHWRDPESLARLTALLSRLARRVSDEWSR
jgi:hypothetical protein